MKHRIEKANEYYRSQNPGAIIFYKLPLGYVTFGEGVEKVGSLLGIQPHTIYDLSSVTIPHKDFLDKVEILGACGIGWKSISYFDDDGQLTIPDVDRLIEEQEIDY